MKPEDIVKAAEEQGLRVQKVTHGWMIYPKDKSLRPRWISRNTDKRHIKNALAEVRRAGVII